MEDNTRPWFTTKDFWQTVKEYFPWIMCCLFIYLYKKAEDEKSEIYKTQIEVLRDSKELNNKVLDLTQKLVDEKSISNHSRDNNRSD